jgi:hypothetical protein
MTVVPVDATLFQTGYSEVSYSDVAVYLKRTFLLNDQKLVTKLIQKKEYELASRCNRNFNITKAYEETLNSQFTEFHPINYPISSLYKITIDGVDKTSSYILNTNYWVYENKIKFLVPVVSSHYQYNSIVIDYYIKQFWGYDVVDYITKAVAYDFLKSENGGIALRQMGFSDINQVFDVDNFNKEQEDIIFRYTSFNV